MVEATAIYDSRAQVHQEEEQNNNHEYRSDKQNLLQVADQEVDMNSADGKYRC